MLALFDFILFAILGLVFVQLAWTRFSSPRKRFHPGPLCFPFIGNLLQLPTVTPWVTYQKWSKYYGPCIHLNVAGLQALVINSASAAEEILGRRGSSYANRPHLIMAGDLCGFGRGLALLPYGKDAQLSRRLIHLTVGAKNIESLEPILLSETSRYLRGLRDTPADFVKHLTYSAGAIILNIAYGYDVKPANDELVYLANDALEKFSRTTILGEFPVDLFPSLLYLPSWFPGGNFKNLAREWSKLGKDLFDKPFNMVKESLRNGVVAPSFAASHLQDLKEWDDHKIGSYAEVIKSTATSLFAGASDTTVSAMEGFFLALTIYPETQRLAQEEIDRVVGTHRLPGPQDRGKLPYCEMLIKEVLRWTAVGPLGIPHVATVDDVYEGYDIAKGTVVIANIWAMLHDPETYPDPMTFNPARFKDGKQPDPARFVFGFGRRMCPGSHLAQMAIFLTVTQTLALFNVSRTRGPSGEEIIPVPEFRTGTISRPKRFPCIISPRETERLRLLD